MRQLNLFEAKVGLADEQPKKRVMIQYEEEDLDIEEDDHNDERREEVAVGEKEKRCVLQRKLRFETLTEGFFHYGPKHSVWIK